MSDREIEKIEAKILPRRTRRIMEWKRAASSRSKPLCERKVSEYANPTYIKMIEDARKAKIKRVRRIT